MCAVVLTLSQGTAVYSLACFAYTFMDDLEGSLRQPGVSTTAKTVSLRFKRQDNRRTQVLLLFTHNDANRKLSWETWV